MTRQNAVLRALAIGGGFLLVAIVGGFFAGVPALTVPVGLILGAIAMWLRIATGQAVPGGRTRRPRDVGIGATIGVPVAVLLGSTLALLDPSAPKLFAVGGSATSAGFVLALIPKLLSGRSS